MKIRLLYSAVLLLAPSLPVTPAPAKPQARPTKNCTAAWLTERQSRPASDRYKRGVADAYGRECLGVTGPKPIDWAQVDADLATLITTDHELARTTPIDITIFCPGYVRANLEKRADFWRKFVTAVIKPEAGTNANAIMWEQPYSNGKPVGGEYSIGLLQLSSSNKRPYDCDIPFEASLLDQTTNLACGVRIVTKLVSQGGIGGSREQGKVGLARYWSTVRVVELKPAASGKRETRQPIINAMRQLEQCKVA